MKRQSFIVLLLAAAAIMLMTIACGGGDQPVAEPGTTRPGNATSVPAATDQTVAQQEPQTTTEPALTTAPRQQTTPSASSSIQTPPAAGATATPQSTPTPAGPSATPRPTPRPTARPPLAQTSPETDREALVALFNATDGERWDTRGTWLSLKPMGEWVGVTTDDSGRVVALRLSEAGLSGEIPPELGNLVNLERLDLSFNRALSGEIPPELGNLVNLTQLSLVYNDLSGEIPPELGNLANLEDLNLRYNQLSGGIPPELGNLANLTHLDLGDNQFSGEIPPDVGNLSNLKRLDLDGNQFSGCISDYLSEKSIYLSGKGWRVVPICVTTDDPNDVEALIALYNTLESSSRRSIYNWLSRLPIGEWVGVSVDLDGRVVALNLSETRLSGEIPPELAGLTSLIPNPPMDTDGRGEDSGGV